MIISLLDGCSYLFFALLSNRNSNCTTSPIALRSFGTRFPSVLTGASRMFFVVYGVESNANAEPGLAIESVRLLTQRNSVEAWRHMVTWLLLTKIGTTQQCALIKDIMPLNRQEEEIRPLGPPQDSSWIKPGALRKILEPEIGPL